MDSAVQSVAGTLRLGLLSSLIRMLEWPDWQMPALFTKGFNVVDSIPPLNIHPEKYTPHEEPFEDMLLASSCDQWNSKLSRDLEARDYDTEIFEGAVQNKGLISRFFSKREMDDHLAPASGEVSGGTGSRRARRARMAAKRPRALTMLNLQGTMPQHF